MQVTVKTASGEQETAPLEAWLAGLVAERAGAEPGPLNRVIKAEGGAVSIRVTMHNGEVLEHKASDLLTFLARRTPPAELDLAIFWLRKGLASTNRAGLSDIHLVSATGQSMRAPMEAWVGGLVQAMDGDTRARVLSNVQKVHYSTPGSHIIEAETGRIFE